MERWYVARGGDAAGFPSGASVRQAEDAVAAADPSYTRGYSAGTRSEQGEGEEDHTRGYSARRQSQSEKVKDGSAYAHEGMLDVRRWWMCRRRRGWLREEKGGKAAPVPAPPAAANPRAEEAGKEQSAASKYAEEAREAAAKTEAALRSLRLAADFAELGRQEDDEEKDLPEEPHGVSYEHSSGAPSSVPATAESAAAADTDDEDNTNEAALKPFELDIAAAAAASWPPTQPRSLSCAKGPLPGGADPEGVLATVPLVNGIVAALRCTDTDDIGVAVEAVETLVAHEDGRMLLVPEAGVVIPLLITHVASTARQMEEARANGGTLKPDVMTKDTAPQETEIGNGSGNGNGNGSGHGNDGRDADAAGMGVSADAKAPSAPSLSGAAEATERSKKTSASLGVPKKKSASRKKKKAKKSKVISTTSNLCARNALLVHTLYSIAKEAEAHTEGSAWPLLLASTDELLPAFLTLLRPVRDSRAVVGGIAGKASSPAATAASGDSSGDGGGGGGGGGGEEADADASSVTAIGAPADAITASITASSPDALASPSTAAAATPAAAAVAAAAAAAAAVPVPVDNDGGSVTDEMVSELGRNALIVLAEMADPANSRSGTLYFVLKPQTLNLDS
jgi:hypothetical protein